MPFISLSIKEIIANRKESNELFEIYYNEIEKEFKKSVKKKKYRSGRRKF